jgi:hypothetical protein
MGNKRGSIAIESMLVMSFSILVLFTTIGLALSIYVQSIVVSEMRETADEISAVMSITLKDNTLSSRVTNQIILAGTANLKLKHRLKHFPLVTKVSSNASKIDNNGMMLWRVEYTVTLPLLQMKPHFTMPIRGVVQGDKIDPEEEIVYYTRTGKRYHLETCYHLRQSKIEVNLKGAISRGYTPCKVCEP